MNVPEKHNYYDPEDDIRTGPATMPASAAAVVVISVLLLLLLLWLG